MIKVLARKINSGATFRMQNTQYSDKIILSDTVPASASHLGKASVSNLGDFLCQHLTGHFETLEQLTGSCSTHVIDDEINHLRGQLMDGAGNRKLFNDYIPLDLFLSPGRMRSINAANTYAAVSDGSAVAPIANAAPALFYPFEFEYLFSRNTDILLDVKNDSTYAINYEIVFHGIRVLGR